MYGEMSEREGCRRKKIQARVWRCPTGWEFLVNVVRRATVLPGRGKRANGV